MQITVTIPDEIAARIRARGATPERLVEDWVAEQEAALDQEDLASEKEPNPVELSASLDAMARYSNKIPSLPIESFSRESLYQDHD